MDMDFPKINGRLAFFDFDRTLVAHTYSAEYARARADSYFAECLYMLTSLEEEHKNDRPLPCMQWYAGKLYEEGYGLYVLTHEVFNLRDELKKRQLKQFYPDIPMAYLTVGRPEQKIDMIMAVAAADGCDLSDVIFVDDRMETVNMAAAAGIDARHLSDIVVLYENSRPSWQQDTAIKPKGLAQILEEDPSLTRKVTYEEAMGFETGITDEGLEDVYLECLRLAEMNGRDKGGGTNL